MTLLGLFGYKQTFFTPKVDQVIQDSNKFFLGSKITFLKKWPQLTLLDEFDVEKKLKFPEHAEYS